MNDTSKRRDFLKLGMAGLATAGVIGAAASVDVQKAAAQSAGDSRLRTVLDRGKLIVGTGSTNAPWHFEDDERQARRHGHRDGAHPRQGPVRRREQDRVRHPGRGAAHPEHRERQGRHHDPVHDRHRAARAARGVLAAVLRRGHRAAGAQGRRAQDLRRDADGGAETKVSILQNADAEKNVTRCCRRRRCCRSTRRPM